MSTATEDSGGLLLDAMLMLLPLIESEQTMAASLAPSFSPCPEERAVWYGVVPSSFLASLVTPFSLSIAARRRGGFLVRGQGNGQGKEGQQGC